ncbi:putative bis(5 -adenosyl)-triphosphatase protein [Botrytis fragariae]|uniref:Putative bis(5 -adenosyl)-triphosphatase protein n=1 Tax=Botrytis fragariae TaxID=1964551 RepID=A0A8H6AVG1_9HELO|nr:putative bis(5 -adenosyl)-triphosphatase protein [Botrytis fragariae]KAF5874419.1 putative bis(5 -adenosyl)-triphosphatase protein [Botrytis fragariae]
MTDLSRAELDDIFSTTQKVQRMLAAYYFPDQNLTAGSFNIAIQDGPESGQTVPHFHCHVIPRTQESARIGDGIYDKLQGEEGNVGGGLWDRDARMGERPVQKGKFPKVDEEDRVPRSAEVMNQEAALFREQMLKLGYREVEQHDP